MKLKKFLPVLFLTGLIAVILLLILYPERYIKSSMNGISLFVKVVLPSLFPFFFITALLTRMKTVSSFAKLLSPLTKKIFRCPGISSYVYIMSILSGYPVGCKIIAELYENKVINSNEATKMSTFCSTSGPLFIIGSIGVGMLANKTAGLTLYLCHILSGFLCGIIFRFYGDTSTNNMPVKKPAIDNILGEAIYTSVISILTVGGFITVFYILADMLIDFNVLLPLQCFISLLLVPFTKDTTLAKYISEGIIEGTRGCGLLASLSSPLILPAISFVIAFGGLSIIIQQLTYLKKAKANLGIFMLSKFVHAILSFIICLIII